MKTLAAAIFAIALTNAQAATLQDTATRCVLDGVNQNLNAVRAPSNFNALGMGEISWSDVNEALYCPHIIDRANAEVARQATDAKARFQADLMRYSTPQ